MSTQTPWRLLTFVPPPTQLLFTRYKALDLHTIEPYFWLSSFHRRGQILASASNLWLPSRVQEQIGRASSSAPREGVLNWEQQRREEKQAVD
ncbi:hypothetical protein C2845_PM02G17260 [Panicum miliaceum]|uniref:Uncharacterized protein n=1 Tax=Panicum miliaceum TaxID=4540 RepID=A0A3L6S5E2_PANMI|nr:hypothetical protein C2845_PM02G17260 [Panicum miliaceum]